MRAVARSRPSAERRPHGIGIDCAGTHSNQFLNENSNVSLSYKVTGKMYPVHVLETREGETRELPSKQTCGRKVPLYVGSSSRPPN